MSTPDSIGEVGPSSGAPGLRQGLHPMVVSGVPCVSQSLVPTVAVEVNFQPSANGWVGRPASADDGDFKLLINVSSAGLFPRPITGTIQGVFVSTVNLVGEVPGVRLDIPSSMPLDGKLEAANGVGFAFGDVLGSLTYSDASGHQVTCEAGSFEVMPGVTPFGALQPGTSMLASVLAVRTLVPRTSPL